MPSLIVLHAINALVGCLCSAILGLTTNAIIVKGRINPSLPNDIESTGMGMLMWAGCGGIVDMLLLLCLISTNTFRRTEVCMYCDPRRRDRH